MSDGRLGLILAFFVLGFGSGSQAADDPWFGLEATPSRVTTIEIGGSSPKVVLDSPHRFAAPEWTPDGTSLIVNGGGTLWRLPALGGSPTPIAIARSGWIDINHSVSPDGKSLAFTSGALWKVASDGGEPVQVTANPGNYVHGWSPDGKGLMVSSNRGQGIDLFSISPESGEERRLTTSPRLDDAGQSSSDGRWLYFVSDRSGNREIWRIPASGEGPGGSKAERITSDDRQNASPRPSPDGKWLIYLSYPPRSPFNAIDRDVLIRRIPLPVDGPVKAPVKAEDVVRIVGGHGTLGSRPFSPDGRRFVYSSFEPPSPTIRIVLFTPSDKEAPSSVPHRLTQNAEAAERFFFSEMARWKYPPAVSRLFARNPDGTVEITYVKGDRPASDPYYTKAGCDTEAKIKAKRQLRIAGEGHYWWTFLYIGDRPTRFGDWQGGGCSLEGGGAIVNYDTLPGEIRLDQGLGVGFNADYFLKGTIHELGHALALPHIGPDLSLKRGNSLMGANNSVYAERKYSFADQVYLTEASAAMLWKHPVFSGTAQDRQKQANLKLVDYKATYRRSSNQITLAGKLVSEIAGHSVVVLDDLGKPNDEYWYRSHVGRIEPNGQFRVVIDRPARADGQFRITFCLENGAVTGDGVGVGFNDRGEIRKGYRFRDGGYVFGN
jgi:hypothetical protein